MSCAEWYRWFGEHEAPGRSPSYSRLALAVADDAELCRLIERLPSPKQQPNLLFAATRFLSGPTDGWAAFRAFVTQYWVDVSELMSTRSTQTNESGRCASFLPLLARLPQPVALVELGASAGLCLYPDRYQYRYGDVVIGASAVSVDVSCTGPVPVPTVLPEVVARMGVDLEPRDVTDPDHVAWLRACIWPEQVERQQRFDAAAAVVAADPPILMVGDLVESLPALLAEVPDAATTVVFHSAVFMYLSEQQRRSAAELLGRNDDIVWLSNESPGLVPGLSSAARPPAGQSQTSYMEVGVGGLEVAALTGPHGSWLDWLERRGAGR